MPDAPPPVFDRAGALERAWTLTATYHPATDTIWMTWHKDGNANHRARVGKIAYPVTEPGDLIEGLSTMVYDLNTRSLF